MTRLRPRLIAACLALLATSVVRAQPAPVFTPVPLAGGPGHRGEATRAWMSAQLGAFGLEEGVDGLRLEREEPLPGGGIRVLVRQLWHGLPVAGADARAIVGGDGQFTSLITGFQRDLRAPFEPRVSAAAAAERAARAAGLAPAVAPGAATLTVERRADGDHLEWEVVQRRADGEPLRTRIDAVSGEVLDVDAGIAHAVGRVYPTDPRQPLEERELPGLLSGPPLRSSAFGLDDALAPPVLPVAPGDYRLPPDDPGFDQVNLYWHVDHYLNDFFGALGYPGPPDSLVVRLHFALDPEVARTNGSFVTFGTAIPGFCREPSRSHDIVYHELGHAVLYGYGIQPGGLNREASALHEGLADYFTAAFTGDPAIAEWAYLVFPNGTTRVDQPVPPWDYAHYDQVAFGGGGLASPWGNGMILSSALWDLRQRIGVACDSLVLEALAYLPTVPTWAQFANGLFNADHDHHGDRFWPTIGDVLRHRGIHGSVVATITGPVAPPPGQTVEYRAFPCCGSTAGHYHWRARTRCRGMPCGDWRDIADGDVLRTAFLDDSELELSVESQYGDRDTTRMILAVATPLLTIEGPTQLTKNAVGTWNVRVTAAWPWTVFLYRQWLAPGTEPILLGTGTSVTFAVLTSFRLTAMLRDGLGRSATAELVGDTFTDRPPPSAKEAVRLSQSMTDAHHAETRVELAEARALRVVVYDIRGRQRLVLADEPEPRGERVIRWDPGVLEPGIYFVRAGTTVDHSAKLRFVVLR